jgi:adenylate kinase family enzyme
MKDCVANGWVIEDFPKTRNQAMFMAKRGLVPTNVFYMKQSVEETYKRTHGRAEEKFGCIRTILASRVKTFFENLPHVMSFYQRLYNNFIEIDSTKSKWFIEDRALSQIQKNIEARQLFARDYHLREKKHGVVCKMRNLHMDRCLMK